MIQMEQLLREIGISEIPQQGEDGTYIIDIRDSNDYGKYYSKLDRSDLLDEDEESSNVTVDGSTIVYISDDYTLTLIADFASDQYKLTIREND